MLEMTARLDSERPQRYVKQIVSHLGNRLETELIDAEHGRVSVPGGGSCMLTVNGSAIELSATAADAESMARIQDVVARHLLRFTRASGLTVDWNQP